MGILDSPDPSTEPAPLEPAEPQWTAPGIIGAVFGLLVFSVGALSGFNIIVCGIGLLFVAAGYAARKKAPEKVCPACRMSVFAAATVCGHCRRDLIA